MKASRRALISGVFHVRNEHFENGWIMPQYHFHEPYEIYVLLEGQRTFVIEGEHYKLHANEAILFPTGCFHKCYGDTSIKGLCYHFSETYIDKHYSEPAKKQLLYCFSKYIVIRLDNNAMQKIIEHSKLINDNDEWKYVHLGILLELLTVAGKHQSSSLSRAILSDSSFAHTVSPLIEYINENYVSINSLKDISQAMDISESYLCKIFKKQTGMTLTYYINRLKIQYACHRLLDSERTISSIARESGYESASYFIRVFKKIVNCTPTEFRGRS